MSKEKIPITMEELEDLVRLLAKYIATNKGANLQRTDPEAHALLVKWNKYQRCYKNRIQHFLPRIGDHPDATLHNVIAEWDPKAKKNDGVDVEIRFKYLSIFLQTLWPRTNNGTRNTFRVPL